MYMIWARLPQGWLKVGVMASCVSYGGLAQMTGCGRHGVTGPPAWPRSSG